MSETPLNSPPSPPPGPPPKSQTDFHIGEEFGTARRNLPPAGIVLLCLLVAGLIVGGFAYFHRAQPQGAGSIDFVSAVEVPGQNSILVALTLTLRNSGKSPL